MNSVPIFIEKTFKHTNGQTFKVLHTLSNSQSFFLEYPQDISSIASHRLLLSQIKSGLCTSYTYLLEIYGVGYKAWKEGEKMYLGIGKARPQEIDIPKDIKVEISKNGLEIYLFGRFIQDVSLFASKIRDFKPAHKDRYKQKGLKLIRKVGVVK